MEVIDNVNKTLKDDILLTLRSGSKVAIAASCFSIYAFQELKEQLSATPVNNRFNDLRNQLALAYEGDSSIMDAQLKTSSSLDDIFRQAQTAFNRWAKFPAEERTTKALLEMLSFDFFEVLDGDTGSLFSNEVHGLDDFELICFLIVR